MQIEGNRFLSIEQLQDRYLSGNKSKENAAVEGETSFLDIWKQKLPTQETGQIKFSKHAASRLAERNIELTDEQLERLSDGTKKADSKGIRESLIMIDQLAFIVNVPSSTVVTAMDQEQTDEHIFTNIDGAVII